MKKIITFYLSAFMALAATCGTSTAQEAKKIAKVDMKKLFDEYYRTKEENQKFTLEFERFKKENEERLEELRKREESLQKLKKEIEDPTLNENLKKEKTQKFQRELADARAVDKDRKGFIERRTRALNLQKQSIMRSIVIEIQKVVVDYAKEENYDFMFDSSGLSNNQIPIVIYMKDAYDVTGVLLEKLNKDAPKADKEGDE